MIEHERDALGEHADDCRGHRIGTESTCEQCCAEARQRDSDEENEGVGGHWTEEGAGRREHRRRERLRFAQRKGPTSWPKDRSVPVGVSEWHEMSGTPPHRPQVELGDGTRGFGAERQPIVHVQHERKRQCDARSGVKRAPTNHAGGSSAESFVQCVAGLSLVVIRPDVVRGSLRVPGADGFVLIR